MENLPLFISASFVLITFLTLFLIFRAFAFSKILIAGLLLWMILSGIVAYKEFYTVTDTFPPRLLFLIGPPLLTIAILFFSRNGRQAIDAGDLKKLTLVHIVRIPVEIILLWLAIYKTIPQSMTFEGRNFDILSGVSAIAIYYFGFVKRQLSNTVMLIWNFACVLLLLNVVIIGILSAPVSFQQLSFDQPNIAILHFPFVWLPGIIVPVVLLSHLVAIRKLLTENHRIKERKNTAIAVHP